MITVCTLPKTVFTDAYGDGDQVDVPVLLSMGLPTLVINVAWVVEDCA